MNLAVDGAIDVSGFTTFTLAILLLFIGKGLVQRVGWLRRYSIPEAIVGGLLCAAVACALYYGAELELRLTLEARDMLLLYFFAGIGLGSDPRTLRQGGKALAVLLALAGGFIVLQNLLGMAVAGAFGKDPRLGLMAGSIALTGGVGTTLAWIPHFEGPLGLAGAGEIGMATNMVGLVAACVVGGPTAGWLIRRHRVVPSRNPALEIGAPHAAALEPRLDYNAVLLALLWLNLALMLGQGITRALEFAGLPLPAFVGCLLAGIVLRAAADLVAPLQAEGFRLWHWPTLRPALALVSDVCLGMFLTMALMGLQLWILQPLLGFITVVLALQILLVIAFVVWVVFPCMGRDYEAVVVCAGFGGISLGSTATAIANMSAVTREYGNAPRALIVVPLVCGFFIDLVNAVVIGMMAR